MTTLPLVTTGSELGLPVFIRKNMGRIISEWETFAHTIIPNAGILELRDHAEEILDFIADDIETPQTKLESTEKSHGESVQDNIPPTSAAEVHAEKRVVSGYVIVQMVSEYRALRASVVRLWMMALPRTTSADLADLTRFHEAIDQALAESVACFTKKVDASRNLFLGILGHDIRNPLGAISMSAELIKLKSVRSEKQNILASQIADSSLRIGEIVDQLIDLARTRLGTGIAVNRAHMNMGDLAGSLVEETRARYPQRNISLDLAGDLEGDWDRARMGQVFSNLLGNAVQYSDQASRISVVLEGKPTELRLTVHNVGAPIAADAILTIFDSLVRTRESELAEERGSTNLGLGLYIAKEIVVSHGGTITVVSSESEGTTFTVLLPRL
jgi:signal transduction histidine kinase